MVEDNPQELVHDVVAEAVFGGHPLGRPVIGRAEVISSRQPQGARRRITGRRTRPGTSSSRPPATSTHGRLVELLAARVPETAARRAPRPQADRARARRRACASSARTRSSTTSASARPGSRAATSGASPPRCWTRSSAARPRRASSRRSARSAGWRTRSTASRRSTPTPARSASTSAPARRTSSSASRSRRASSRTSPRATCGPGELERAKENLKGRMLLSMESTSNRMSRLGKSLDHRHRAARRSSGSSREIDAVEGRGRRGARGRPARARRAVGRGDRPDEARFRAAVERVNPALVAPRSRVRVALFGRGGKVGRVLAPALEAPGTTLGRSDRIERAGTTSRSTSRAPTRSSTTSCAASRQDVPCVVGTTGLGREELADLDGAPVARAAALRRPELRGRRRADDALRRRGGALLPRRGDRRAAPRDEAGRAVRDGEGDCRAASARPRRSTRCGCPASSPTRR